MKRFTQLLRRYIFYLFRPHFRERYKFEKWQQGFEDVYKSTLHKWQETSRSKSILPEGLEDKVLQQYTTYKTEREARSLVIATFFLAGFAALALIISLIALHSQSDFNKAQANFYSAQLSSVISRDPALQIKLDNFFVENNSVRFDQLSSLAYIDFNKSDFDYRQQFMFRITASNRGLTPTSFVTFLINDNEGLFYIKSERRDLGNYIDPPADILFLGEYKDCSYKGHGYYDYRKRAELCEDSRETKLTTGIKAWTLQVACPSCNPPLQCYSFNICIYNSNTAECGPEWNEETAQLVPIDCPPE